MRGTIVRCGSEVEELRAGDVVVAMAPGSFATFVTVPADFCRAQAGSPVYRRSGHRGRRIRHGRGRPRDARPDAPRREFLIHAAAGGVGMAAVQLAQRAGSRSCHRGPCGQARGAAALVHHILDSAVFVSPKRFSSGPAAREWIWCSTRWRVHPSEPVGAAEGGRFLELEEPRWNDARVKQIRGDVSHYTSYDLGSARTTGHVRDLLRPLMARFDRGAAGRCCALSFTRG